MSNHLITDNVLVAFETMHHISQKRSGKVGEMALKLDMSKAYDRCCEILKYSQVYEPYRSIVGQERGRTHRDLNERRKIKSNLNQINPNPV